LGSHDHVSAHFSTNEAIRRAVECGVMSVERGNLLTPKNPRLLEETGAFVAAGLALGHPWAAEVMMAYGSDLLGEMQCGSVRHPVVVEGNPLEEILLLIGSREAHAALVIKDRSIVKQNQRF
jgi:imidazolonepropionase-like amidohydrolase